MKAGDPMNEDILYHPHFICQRCAADNVLEIDPTEGFPQSFVWDCLRCCNPHEITVLRDGDGLSVQAGLV